MKLPSEEMEVRKARYRSHESLRELESQPNMLSSNFSGAANYNSTENHDDTDTK